ncbi:hypothetical protein FOA43_000645 [Brettanomyces nanus]|uniref:LsmAD domain-containing protein n=1 Tax=Eeniella nana TaxID=13502 RepID=A0A875RZ61_EENNA|nr:uncharacterized protein FOA43_000645 [Brettanomyces nanus]QPG73335.1 hypothetical protein FOA43_000645 [Brettanomyces nanus]
MASRNQGHRRSGSKVGSEPCDTSSENDLASDTVQDSVSLKHMDERLLYGLLKSIGRRAVVTLNTGSKISGILYTVGDLHENSTTFSVCIKYPLVEGSASDRTVYKSEYMIIYDKDIAMIKFEHVDMRPLEITETATVSAETSESDTTSAIHQFKTDIAISSARHFKEHALKRWMPDDGNDDQPLESLGDSKENSNRSSHWNQFETNERKFGIHSTFDETLYTTKISKNGPDFQKRLKEAEKIAHEIESQGTHGNVHLAEERGLQVDDSGMDEEDKYSGVFRDAPVASAGPERDSALLHPKGDKILMGLLKNGAHFSDVKPAVSGDNPILRQRAAYYHNDPAVIYSSAINRAAVKTEPTEVSSDPKTSPASVAGSSSVSPPSTVPKRPSVKASSRQPDIKALKEFSAHLKLPGDVPKDILPVISKTHEQKEQSEKGRENQKQRTASARTTPSTAPAIVAAKETVTAPVTASSSIAASTAASASGTPSLPASVPLASPLSPRYSRQSSSQRHRRSPISFFGPDKVPAEIDNSKRNILNGKFSILVKAKIEYEKAENSKEIKNLKANVIIRIERPFATAPTWPSTSEKSYTSFFSRQPEWVPPPMSRKMYFPTQPVPMLAPQTMPPPMMMPTDAPPPIIDRGQLSPQRSPQMGQPFLSNSRSNSNNMQRSPLPHPQQQPLPQQQPPPQQMRMQGPPAQMGGMQMGAMSQYQFVFQQPQFIPLYSPGPMPVNGPIPFYPPAAGMPPPMMPNNGGGSRRNSRNHSTHYNRQ